MRDTLLRFDQLPSLQAFRRELRSESGQTALLNWGAIPRSKQADLRSVAGIQQWADGFGENVLKVARNAAGRVLLTAHRVLKGGKRLGSRMTSWEGLVSRGGDLGKRLESQGGLGKHNKPIQSIRSAQQYAGRTYYKPVKTRFTNRARQTLLNAGAILDKCSPGNSIFFTATLPGDTDEAKEMLSILSGVVANRFTQWIRDNFPGREWLYVWEWQKRGALHLHMCIASRSPQEAAIIGWNLRRVWLCILADIEDSTGVHMFRNKEGVDHRGGKLSHACRADTLSTGAACYVAKYTTKGFAAGKGASNHYPGRWYAVSASLRRLIRQEEFQCSFVLPDLNNAIFHLYSIVDEMREQCAGTRIHHGDNDNPTNYATMLPFKEQAMAVYHEVVKLAHDASLQLWQEHDAMWEALANTS